MIKISWVIDPDDDAYALRRYLNNGGLWEDSPDPDLVDKHDPEVWATLKDAAGRVYLASDGGGEDFRLDPYPSIAAADGAMAKEIDDFEWSCRALGEDQREV